MEGKYSFTPNMYLSKSGASHGQMMGRTIESKNHSPESRDKMIATATAT